MQGSHQERIRARAYELWEAAGRSGDPQEHWLRAEREEAGPHDSGASADAEKMADQVQVAMDGRKARSKQTGRAGSTGGKKPKPA